MNAKQTILTIIIAIITSLVAQNYLTVNQGDLIEDIVTQVLIGSAVTMTGSVATWDVATGAVETGYVITGTMYETKGDATGEYIGVE